MAGRRGPGSRALGGGGPTGFPPLAGYVHGDHPSDGQVARCRAALERHLRADGSLFLLARAADGVVGFIHLCWSVSTSTGLPLLCVEGLYTVPAYRGQGVAGALLRHAEGLARERGAHRLQLETDQDNLPTLHLYQRFGFERLPRKQVHMKFL